MDRMTPDERSRLMSRIRCKDTSPEMVVRRAVHALGFRYRLHVDKLPGRPDLVFSGRRKVIFVHGCFWHRHEGCRFAYMPKTRHEFWSAKLERNRERDREVIHRLNEAGWKVMVVWECETREGAALKESLRRFLVE
ncbi:DNA mismatch endonuclease Vsr [Blastochloris sulfoviridis]|uniref:Very short patch repair endonuclease n=2 Tax=Blastochloris sulfoviridis TaxID=50712 RepID=A0A5M6I4V2_9HYPH|nr:DNA mismatch endonuclease Vsr [Blastochloris sulfoviridis]KAA5602829.1 DNA mismatch endonuclease Vsr [Blastochloris sulfoviridis]